MHTIFLHNEFHTVFAFNAFILYVDIVNTCSGNQVPNHKYIFGCCMFGVAIMLSFKSWASFNPEL